MNPRKRVCRLVALIGLVAAAVAGPIHADVILDLGRGPVTVHVPPGYDPSEPAPLVMLLHGYGDSGAGLESFLRLTPWSDRLGFLFLAPDGTENDNGYRFWNGTDACCDDGSGVDDSGYLRALIDEVISELSVDTDRIFVVGYSNGGFMAYRMACDHADIVAGIASWAGATYLDPADCSPVAPVRTLQIHGTADVNVPYDGGAWGGVPYPGALESVAQWAAYNQCSTDPDLTPPPLNLDIGLVGYETWIERYADGCQPGGSAELWSIVGATHFPCFSADFTAHVLDFFGFEGVREVLLSHRHFILAAAFAHGAEGAFFQTDVDATNIGDRAARYRFLWLPRGEQNFPATPSEEFVLGPGEAARHANVLHGVFGLEPDALGAIEVEASSPDLLFMSRTYNLDPSGSGGTYGQSMPAISEHDLIPNGERRRILFASEDGSFRTNVACLNSCPSNNFVFVHLYDADGSLLGTERMTLAAFGNDQLNRVLEDYQPVNGYMEVWNPYPERAISCYASVLDNITSDPTTILPQLPSEGTIFIPAAAFAAGAAGSFFATDLDLNNLGPADLSYQLLWLPRGDDNSDPVRSGTYSLAAGADVRYTNVLDEVFGLEPDAVGALAIETSEPSLLAMSRTYTVDQAGSGGTFGQELPGIPVDQMIPTGVPKRIVCLSENDDTRANVGCVNGVGTEVAVALDLYGSDGALLETKYMMLPPYSNRQINGIFHDHAPIDGYVEFRTYTPDALISCYGSVLDNVTSDPTTVMPQ